jgi:hypothetical protein
MGAIIAKASTVGFQPPSSSCKSLSAEARQKPRDCGSCCLAYSYSAVALVVSDSRVSLSAPSR